MAQFLCFVQKLPLVIHGRVLATIKKKKRKTKEEEIMQGAVLDFYCSAAVQRSRYLTVMPPPPPPASHRQLLRIRSGTATWLAAVRVWLVSLGLFSRADNGITPSSHCSRNFFVSSSPRRTAIESAVPILCSIGAH